MKIDGTEGVLQPPKPGKPAKAVDQPGQGFREILKQAASRPAGGPPSPAPVSFCQGPPAPVKAEGQSPKPSAMADRIEGLLDLLEDYRRRLCDPDTNLRALEVLVKKLDNEKRALEPEVDRLPETDRLKPILHQSLVTATVAVFKYYRGDYLAA